MSDQTYVLYIRRRCDKDSEDSSELIGVSLVYVDHDIITHEQIVDNDITYSLKTLNYPNYYSVGSDHKWNIAAKNGSQAVKALLTFTDIELSPGHELLLRSEGYKVSVNRTTDLFDSLVNLPLFMNLTSDSIDSTKTPFSGRGFTANLTAISCGDNVTVDAGKSKDLSTPANLTGISKCIWTVSTTNPSAEVVSVLEFTVNDQSLWKSLRIWDSESIRDNKLMNFSYFNETKNSSTNYLIIEYTIDVKKPMELKLSFTSKSSFD